MNSALLAVLVSLAGGFGAVLRYLIGGSLQRRSSEHLPYGTMAVNVLGSFILGVLTGIVERHGGSRATVDIVGVGLCGGFTTWSAASYETIRLAEDGFYARAAIAAGSGVGLSLLAAALGIGIGLL